MAASRDSTGRARWLSAPAHRLGSTLDGWSTTRIVLAIALVGLVARLALLGVRTMHFDEARVAYRVHEYLTTGSFAYRPIIHGPLVQHVSRWLFPLIGLSNFAVRLPVAIVGSLLPAVALLFRKHLRRSELVALALVLAFNPVLLYYSRFYRSDVLLGTFMLAGLGTIVRLYDTREPRYLYATAVLVALGFGAKESAAIYVLVWVGATALLADQALFRPRRYASGFDLLAKAWPGRTARWLLARVRRIVSPESDPPTGDATDGVAANGDGVRPSARAPVGRALTYAGHAIGAAALFVGVIVYLFAPRGGGQPRHYNTPDGPVTGFWEAIGNPVEIPGMVEHTLTRAFSRSLYWFTRSTEADPNRTLFEVYGDFLGQFLSLHWTHARIVLVFAVFGFVLERYGSSRSRNLVLFAAYGGFVSIVGYPLGMDIFGAWQATHTIGFLAIPAAVALAALYRLAAGAAADRDALGTALGLVVLLVIAAQVGFVAVGSVYANPQSDANPLVQFAQPADDLSPLDERLAAAGGHAGDVDVVVYGDNYVSEACTPGDGPPCVRSLDLGQSLPLHWYVVKNDVDLATAKNESTLKVHNQAQPPMFVAAQEDADILDSLQGYERTEYRIRTSGGPNDTMVVFFDASKVESGG